MLIVLVVFYSGLLLLFITGPSMDDVDDLRKFVFVVAFLAVVACGILIFVGLPVFSIGPTDDADGVALAGVTEDEEEVFLEETLGLSEEAAAQEAEYAADRTELQVATGPEDAASCRKCSAQLIEGSLFCHQCGASASRESTPRSRSRTGQRRTQRRKKEGQG